MARQYLILILLLLSVSGVGQTPWNNGKISGGLNIQKDSLYSFYFESVSKPNEIINGKEYIPYYLHSRTSPLLFSDEIMYGTMITKNREYRNIRLQYDTYLDEIIYTDTSRMIDNVYPRIALNKDIVDGFSFTCRGDTMYFRYLKFAASPENEMVDGFYEIAYDGDTKYIIKHKSRIYNNDALNEYKYSPESYVRKGELFVKITNNKTFLPVFGEWSERIKEFLKKSGIKISKADKDELIKVLVYFDTLKKSKSGE